MTDNPNHEYYLQPYKSQRIIELEKLNPNINNPIKLYISTTDSLNQISFTADIVGWENKEDLVKDINRFTKLNEHIKKHQPNEEEIYLEIPYQMLYQ